MDGNYIFGIIAVVMTLSAFSYQLIKIIKTKESKALSYNLMIWVGAAMALYFVFGLFYLDEIIVWLGNLIGLAINLILLVTKYRLEH